MSYLNRTRYSDPDIISTSGCLPYMKCAIIKLQACMLIPVVTIASEVRLAWSKSSSLPFGGHALLRRLQFSLHCPLC